MKKMIILLSLIVLVFFFASFIQTKGTVNLKNDGIRDEYLEEYELAPNNSRVYRYHAAKDINEVEIDFLHIKDGQAESHPVRIKLDSPKGLIIVKGQDLISDECEVLIVTDNLQKASYNYHLNEDMIAKDNLVYGSLLKEINLKVGQKIQIFHQSSTANPEFGNPIEVNYFDNSSDISSAVDKTVAGQELFLVTIMFGEWYEKVINLINDI